MSELGDGQAIGVKTEGQVQDVWRLSDIIHRKESNTWEDEGFWRPNGEDSEFNLGRSHLMHLWFT